MALRAAASCTAIAELSAEGVEVGTSGHLSAVTLLSSAVCASAGLAEEGCAAGMCAAEGECDGDGSTGEEWAGDG